MFKKIKMMIAVAGIAMVYFSCKSTNPTDPVPDPPKQDTTTLLSVIIEAKNNSDKITSDVKCKIEGNQITALVPSMANNKKFVVSYTYATTGGLVVKANDTTVVNGVTKTDFTKPVMYKVTNPAGFSKTFTFTIRNFTGIPIFYINTSAPVVSKDDYVTGDLTINPNLEFIQEKLNIPLQIKGRGNSTWGHPKKPYRLKFNEKTSVFGLPAAKNWVLLANYSDKTLMRTSIAFDLGRKLGIPFTPHGIFVEVVMNGEHLGNYLLTEQMEVNEGRVNIPELKKGDTSPDKITGGYLLEWDQRLDEDHWFRTSHDIPFTIKSPSDIPDAQFNYIKGYVQQTEDAIFAGNFNDVQNGYAKYIDVESFVNFYLLEELTKNQDAKDFSSIYFFKDRNGKLTLGPVWDFDLAIGNVDYSDATNPTGWWIADGPWMGRLLQDAAFRTKVKNRWNQIKGKEIKQINAVIDSNYRYINVSQQRNFTKWPILGQYVWPNPVVLGTYDKEVDRVKTWLAQREAWLDAEFNKW